MTTPLVAVAIQQDGTVSPHAGRALLWQVFAVEGATPEKVWELTLNDAGCLHEWHVRNDGNRHPLHSVDIAIAGSGGDGVKRRLGERDTNLVTTSETDPLKAVQNFLAGNLAAGAPHNDEDCLNPQHRQAAVSA